MEHFWDRFHLKRIKGMMFLGEISLLKRWKHANRQVRSHQAYVVPMHHTKCHPCDVHKGHHVAH